MRRSTPAITLTCSLVLTLAAALGSPEAAADPSSFASGTEFVYQGSLKQAGEPAEGSFDLSFELFDARRGGSSFGQIDLFDVPVEHGAFAVELDFRRSIFTGDLLWVETKVRAAGDGGYATLSPRDLAATRSGGTCIVGSDVLISGGLVVDLVSPQIGVEIDCCSEASTDGGGQLVLVGDPGALRFDYDEIQSTIGLSPWHLQLNPQGGRIGLGVSNPAHPVHVPDGPDVTAAAGGALVVGFGTNLAIDQDEIQAHSGGAPSLLTLNDNGGNVRVGGWLGVGLSTSNPVAPLQLPPGPGASGTGGGSLVVGYSTNVAIDQNEIQAHQAGGPALLRINRSGGDVRIGGSAGMLDIGLQRVHVESNASSIDAVCPSGTLLISGGCHGNLDNLVGSWPVNSTTWNCWWDETDVVHNAFAICGRVRW